ncbi:MAG: hypothetical protein QM750_04930 [Rubrivivax sp.]
MNAAPRISMWQYRQRGLSVVELMVGVAIDIIVVAAAALMAATQLSENRRLLLEAQVQQDLRAAADAISRQVRRSGSKLNPEEYVWTPANGSVTLPGTVDDVTPTTTSPASAMTFRYNRTGTTGGLLGYQLSGTTIQTRMPAVTGVADVYQDLTDAKSMNVGVFQVQAQHVEEPKPASPDPVDPEQYLPCPKLCPGGTTPLNATSCWPTARVREFKVNINASAVHDTAVKRSLEIVVRPRNDELVMGASLCPT